MTYSMDLRERVVMAVRDGEPIALVARRFRVARPTVRDWRDRAEQGMLEPGVGGPKAPTKITPQDDRLMIEMIAERPGITANQLRALLSVEVAECTVCRRLKKLGLTLKKNR
jgi:transposase